MKLFKITKNTIIFYAVLCSIFIYSVSSVRAQTFENPLQTDSITELLTALLTILVIIGTPIVIFFIVFSGFKFVIAQGNPEELQTAKRSLIYAIVGGLILLGAFSITTIIENLVSDFTN